MTDHDLLAGTAANPRVLIVEDDPVSAMLIQRLFKSAGIFVDRAADGRVALEMHRQNKYRLVISDWMMPEMNGVDLCRAFRKIEGPYVYFVLCSAKGQRDDRIEAFDSGVDDFLSKPLDKEELHARLTVARRILATEEDLQHQKTELEQATRSLSDLNASLMLASRRFEELFNGLPVACFTFDQNGLIHEWNRRSEHTFGIPAYEAVQKPIWDLLRSREEGPWEQSKIGEVFEAQDQPGFDWTFTHPDGHQKYLAGKVICLRAIGGQPVGAVCANLDITARKEAEQQVSQQMDQINEYASQLALQRDALEEMNQRLSELAITDGLTGLWNHRRFQELLDETSEQHARAGHTYSLMLIDIDKFKQVNDDFGHQVGDEVLKQFGSILKSSARQYELPARYGGEEFAVILQNCDEESAMVVAERIRTQVAGAEWPHRAITCSLGVATCHLGQGSPKQLIAEADAALYASKESGRNRATHASALSQLRPAA